MIRKKVSCNKTLKKTEIKKLTEWFLSSYGTIRTVNLLDNLKRLGFKYATKAGISLGMEDFKIPPLKRVLIDNADRESKKSKYKYLINDINELENSIKLIETWNKTNELLKDEVIKNFRETDLLNPLYMMVFSGARGNISQIRQLTGMRGLISGSQGQILDLPIRNNLKEGLNITEYFVCCYGARKGLIDTALKTANSGYLTRRLVYVAQSTIVKKNDCSTKRGLAIFNKSKTKSGYTYLAEKLVGRVLAKTITEKNTKKVIASKNQDICKFVLKRIIDQKKFIVRSPLNCNLNTGICQLCYGWNLGNGRLVEIGETIGILASQSIGEPGTQLTMRTFHTGGVFSGEIAETITSPEEGIINYDSKKNGKKITTVFGEKAFFTFKEKLIILIKNKNSKFKLKIPKHSLIFVRPRKKVFNKQVIGEISNWKKINNKKTNTTKDFKEVKADISGSIAIENARKDEKKILWIIQGKIFLYYQICRVTWKTNILGKNQKRERKNKKVLRYTTKLFILLKESKKWRRKKQVYRILKKIEQKKNLLMEKDNKDKKTLRIKGNNPPILGNFIRKGQSINSNKVSCYSGQISQQKSEEITVNKGNPYIISRNSKIPTKQGNLIKKNDVIFYRIFKTQKTEDIVQGLPKIEEILEARKNKKAVDKTGGNLHEKLANIFKTYTKKYRNNEVSTRKTIEKIQKIIIQKIQSVYQSQKVNISDKHLEIIVKQMTSRVLIKEEGESNVIPGEIIEINKIEKINKSINAKATYEPVILGITKSSLSQESFLSKAGFQESIKILSKSAIQGEIDWLYGMKENLIMGNLIPAGTGYRFL